MSRSLPSFLVVLLSVALALVGYALIPRLSVRWLPSIQRIGLQVTYEWAGVSPQLLEQQATLPATYRLALVEYRCDLYKS